MENNIILGITSVPSAVKQSSSGRRRGRSGSRVSPRGQYRGGGVYILNEGTPGCTSRGPRLRGPSSAVASSSGSRSNCPEQWWVCDSRSSGWTTGGLKVLRRSSTLTVRKVGRGRRNFSFDLKLVKESQQYTCPMWERLLSHIEGSNSLTCAQIKPHVHLRFRGVRQWAMSCAPNGCRKIKKGAKQWLCPV